MKPASYLCTTAFVCLIAYALYDVGWSREFGEVYGMWFAGLGGMCVYLQEKVAMS